MTQCAWRLILGLVFAFLPAVAGAQGGPPPQPAPNPDAQSIRIGTQIFYDYTHTAEPKSTDADGNQYSPSAFNLQRAYLNVIGTLSHVVSFRVTPDVRRETGSGSSLNGSLTLRIKYAYAQFALDDWMPAGSQVRIGIIQTPFIDTQESVYRYRFQGTAFAERDGGLVSADAGVSFRMPLPSDYGDVQVGVYNGEGYSQQEANDTKSLQLRGTIRPLPTSDTLRGLRVTAFYNDDSYVRNAERQRFFASAMYEHARFNAGFDYATGEDRPSAAALALDSGGYSFFVTPFLDEKGRGWEGLLRYDTFDNDRDTAGTRNRWIGGIAYWFPHPAGSATAALLLDYEQVNFHDYPAALKPATQKRIALHGLINF